MLRVILVLMPSLFTRRETVIPNTRNRNRYKLTIGLFEKFRLLDYACSIHNYPRLIVDRPMCEKNCLLHGINFEMINVHIFRLC